MAALLGAEVFGAPQPSDAGGLRLRLGETGARMYVDVGGMLRDLVRKQVRVLCVEQRLVKRRVCLGRCVSVRRAKDVRSLPSPINRCSKRARSSGMPASASTAIGSWSDSTTRCAYTGVV